MNTRRHSVLISGLAVTLLLGLSVPAVADIHSTGANLGAEEGERGGFGYLVSDDRPAVGEAAGRSGADGGGPIDWVPYTAASEDPATGERCRHTRWYAIEDESQRSEIEFLAINSTADFHLHHQVVPPTCPWETEDLPGDAVREAVEEIVGTIEPARPYVQPGNRAITGITSYLDTGVESSMDRRVTVTLFGTDRVVDVSIEGEHTVDWGDGTPVEVTSSRGGPWHEGPPVAGDIWHHYLETGDHVLTVDTEWTVTATLGEDGASATQTVTTASLPVTVAVSEVRSVRTD